MWTYQAERLVPDDPSAVHTAIASLVDDLWGDRHRTLLSAADERIDAITRDATSEVVDVWVTWKTHPRVGGTSVQITLDEVETGPAPDLPALLEAMAQRIHTPPTAAR